MKSIIIGFLVSILIISFVNGQNLLDSILNNQVRETKNVGAQIRKLRKEIESYSLLGLENKGKQNDTIAIIGENLDSLYRAYYELENEVASLKGENEGQEESLWQKSMPEIVEAFIGVGSALLVFYLGMRRERRKERSIQKKAHQEKIHYLGSLTKSTIELSKKQLDGLKEFCQEIDNAPMNIPLIPIIPTQDIARLSKTFDNEEYYHSFLDEFGNETEKVESYRNLTTTVDFLLKQFEQVLDMQGKKQNFDAERKRQYGRLLDIVKDEVLRTGEKYKKTNIQFSIFILNTFKKHYDGLNDNNRTDLRYVEETLVIPLKRGFINEFKGIEESNYFVQKLKEMTSIFDEIPRQNQKHAEDYRTILEKVHKAIVMLEEKGKGLLSKLDTAANKVQNGQPY